MLKKHLGLQTIQPQTKRNINTRHDAVSLNPSTLGKVTGMKKLAMRYSALGLLLLTVSWVAAGLPEATDTPSIAEKTQHNPGRRGPENSTEGNALATAGENQHRPDQQPSALQPAACLEQPDVDTFVQGPPSEPPAPPPVKAAWKLLIDEAIEQIEEGNIQSWSVSELYLLVEIADFVALDGESQRVEQLISLAQQSRKLAGQNDPLLAELYVAQAIAHVQSGTLRMEKIEQMSLARLKADGLRRLAVAFAETGDRETTEKVVARLVTLADKADDWRDRYHLQAALGRLYGQLGREQDAHAVIAKIGQTSKFAREAGADQTAILAAEQEALTMIPLGLCEGELITAARGELFMYSRMEVPTDTVSYELAARLSLSLDFMSAARSALEISDDFLRAKCLQEILQQALKIDPLVASVTDRLTQLAIRESAKVRSNPVLFAEIKALASTNAVAWGLDDGVENYLKSATPRHQVPVLAAMIRKAYAEKNVDQQLYYSEQALGACAKINDAGQRRLAFGLVGEVMGNCGLDPISIAVETEKGFQRACGLLGMAKGRKLAHGRELIHESGLKYIGPGSGKHMEHRDNTVWKAFCDSLQNSHVKFFSCTLECKNGTATALATAKGFNLAAPATREGLRGFQTLIMSSYFEESQQLILNKMLFAEPGTVEQRGKLQFTKRLAGQPENWLVISVTQNE